MNLSRGRALTRWTASVLNHGMAIVLTGISTSTNALQAFQASLDTSANNLANAATNAFKSQRTLFQDLLSSGPLNAQVGHGTQVASSDRNFAQGKTIPTGNDLDLAVQGQGFFSVLNANGTTEYSRDGSFHLDANRSLVTSDGSVVQPPITIPEDAISTNIASDGTVSVLTGSSPNTPIVLGQLQLTNFINPQGLKSVGGNRYAETKSSGTPLTDVPGTNGLGLIVQGSLEESNVDTTTEMVRLVNTSRSYVSNSRALKVEDEILKSGLDIVS